MRQFILKNQRMRLLSKRSSVAAVQKRLANLAANAKIDVGKKEIDAYLARVRGVA